MLAGRVVVAHLKLAQRVHQLRRRGGRVAPDQHLLTTKTTTAAESFSLSLVSQNEVIKIVNSHLKNSGKYGCLWLQVHWAFRHFLLVSNDVLTTTLEPCAAPD